MDAKQLVTRLWEDAEGVSHFGAVLQPLKSERFAPPAPPLQVSAGQDANKLFFLELPVGWKGLQVTRILWPTYFSKQAATSTESRIDALSAAIRIWPQSEFYQDRATVFQTLAGSNDQPVFREYAERAIDDYQQASLLKPFDPGLVVNRANLLSQLQRVLSAGSNN